VAAPRRRPLGILFLGLTVLFAAVTAYAAASGQWIIAAAAGVIGVWMADLAYRAVR
jgi:succinate-acetate transporter protein